MKITDVTLTLFSVEGLPPTDSAQGAPARLLRAGAAADPHRRGHTGRACIGLARRGRLAIDGQRQARRARGLRGDHAATVMQRVEATRRATGPPRSSP